MLPESEAPNQRCWRWTSCTGAVHEAAEGRRHAQVRLVVGYRDDASVFCQFLFLLADVLCVTGSKTVALLHIVR